VLLKKGELEEAKTQYEKLKDQKKISTRDSTTSGGSTCEPASPGKGIRL
jgi:hypothetical protein